MTPMKTALTQHATLAAFLALVFTASVCWGAKAPISAKDREKQSTHIVTGKVVATKSKIQKSKFETGAGNQDELFSIKVIVTTTTKGEGIKKGDEILVIAWKPHARIGLARLGLQGHVPIPEKGQVVTFYLKRAQKGFEPLLPNGMEIKHQAQGKGEDGADQPTTAPEPKPKGKQKPISSSEACTVDGGEQ